MGSDPTPTRKRPRRGFPYPYTTLLAVICAEKKKQKGRGFRTTRKARDP